jgi:hypothetical protein
MALRTMAVQTPSASSNLIHPQPEAAPLAHMHIFSQPDIRPERPKISLIGNLSHKPAKLHAGFLAVGPAFPVMPVKDTLTNLDFPGLFNQVFEFPVVEPVAAMEIGKERYAPQEVPEEDMELEVLCQPVLVLDPRRGDERDTHHRRRYRMLHNDVRPSYRIVRLPEHLVIAFVYKRFARIFILEGIFFKYLPQLILSPALPDADPAKLVKRIDEVWQVVCGTADQGEAEGEGFSLFAGPLAVRGRLKDEGMGGHGVLSHHLSIFRDGGLKDIGIDTPVSQETIRAFLAFEGADDTPEGMAETTAEGGAGIGRQRDLGLAPGGKDESGKVEFFQAVSPLQLQVYEQLVNGYYIRYSFD